MSHESERFEDWLDGKLSGEERASFEQRLLSDESMAAELGRQRAIDDVLKRQFAAPDHSNVRLEPAPVDWRSSPGVPTEQPFLRHRRKLAAAAALVAAAVVLFLVLGRRGADATGGYLVDGETPIAFIDPQEFREFAACTETHADLANLFHQVVLTPAPPASCGTEAEAQRDGLSCLLSERYGQPMNLLQEAGDVLAGPLHTDEWSSGTVFAGYPDGPGEEPSVLVAERTTCQQCCIHYDPPGDGLRVFTHELDGVTLTEITRSEKPRLIPMFDVF